MKKNIMKIKIISTNGKFLSFFFVVFKRIERNRRRYHSQMYYISIVYKGIPRTKRILEKIINFRRNIRKIHFEDLDKNLRMLRLNKVI
jgi:hypothetical protein